MFFPFFVDYLIKVYHGRTLIMKEMVILPDGSVIYLAVSDYWFNSSLHKYETCIVYKGVNYIMHFYNNFWA